MKILSRFDKLKNRFSKQKSVSDPEALLDFLGRKENKKKKSVKLSKIGLDVLKKRAK